MTAATETFIMQEQVERLHADSVIIDAVCPLLSDEPKYLDLYREGGVTVVAPTVGSSESARVTLNRMAMWHHQFAQRPDLMLVRRADDVEHAKRAGRLGVYLHFQGTDPIEDNLDLVDLYKALGVGVIQLTYNVSNRVGDGCEERVDAGLSRFGIRLIERLNLARVIVDCSHTGLRTSLDAIEHSSAPVILSHANLRRAHQNPRNVPDELVDAIAGSGGVIGVVGFPAFVSGSTMPTLDDFVAHIDAVVERAGIDHVGLGIDYYRWQAGIASDEQATAFYEATVRRGRWSANSYPPPPHHYPRGIETPRTLRNLTQRLIERGYAAGEVSKILGGNWLRVMRAVWG